MYASHFFDVGWEGKRREGGRHRRRRREPHRADPNPFQRQWFSLNPWERGLSLCWILSFPSTCTYRYYIHGEYSIPMLHCRLLVARKKIRENQGNETSHVVKFFILCFQLLLIYFHFQYSEFYFRSLQKKFEKNWENFEKIMWSKILVKIEISELFSNFWIGVTALNHTFNFISFTPESKLHKTTARIRDRASKSIRVPPTRNYPSNRYLSIAFCCTYILDGKLSSRWALQYRSFATQLQRYNDGLTLSFSLKLYAPGLFTIRSQKYTRV